MTWESTREKVLAFPEIAKLIKDDPQAIAKVDAYLKEMHSVINFKIGRAVSRIISASLRRLYNNVYLSVPPDIDLVALAEQNKVVFVPNHQSHADYLIFNTSIYEKYGIATYCFGGDNLNLFLVGPLLSRLGTVFIRRKFNGNEVYKMTFKAYLCYLMDEIPNPLEFYFEGGRSRNGMLLTPKFGMFKFLLSNQDYLAKSQENAKPLVFLPVSIVHEDLPEQQSMAKEVLGLPKTKESLMQVIKALRVLGKHLGTVHIKMGEPVFYRPNEGDERQIVEKIAFACYREVARGIVVTPTALLAIIALDCPESTLSIETILFNAERIIEFCKKVKVPLAPSLQEEEWHDDFKETLSTFCQRNVIQKITMPHLGQAYYTLSDSKRVEMAYFKNTILHHFLVPFLIYLAWVKTKNNQLGSEKDIVHFFLERRKELKYEFYLPTISKMWQQAFVLLSDIVHKPIKHISDWLALSLEEKETIGRSLSYAGYFFRYKYEAYGLAMLTLLRLASKHFTEQDYLAMSREIFALEQMNGNIIKFPESYSIPIMKNTLNFAINSQLVNKNDQYYTVIDIPAVKAKLDHFLQDLFDIYRSKF